MIIEARAGQGNVADGSQIPLRVGRTTSLAVMDAHSRYYDAVSRGNCFVAATSTAPVALGTALTATAVTLTLHNPPASNRLAVLMHTQLAIASNISSSGIIVYAVNNTPGQAIPSSVTQITPQNLLLAAGTNPTMRAYSAATLPATPTATRILWSNTAFTNLAGQSMILDNIDGAIVLTPNTSVTIQAVAGTAPLGTISMAWEEVNP